MSHSHGPVVQVSPERAATLPTTHHGRTLAAWVGSVVTGVGSVIATVGFLLNINWPVVWVGLVVMVAGGVVGGVMRKLGHGAPE